MLVCPMCNFNLFFWQQHVQLIHKTEKFSESRPAKGDYNVSLFEQFANADLYIPDDSTPFEGNNPE